ncbi:MAG: response regulator [Blastocatellia bacterium]|nr:response regulator [Blastocatellia bacterium]
MLTPRFRESSKTSTVKRKVLVVDDSSLARHLMRSALSQTFDVVEASDGLEAIGLLSHSADFACVVTDDQMPGCTGIEVLDFIKRTPATKKIPVVIITSGTEQAMTRHIRGHVSGAAVFMNKPVARGSTVEHGGHGGEVGAVGLEPRRSSITSTLDGSKPKETSPWSPSNRSSTPQPSMTGRTSCSPRFVGASTSRRTVPSCGCSAFNGCWQSCWRSGTRHRYPPGRSSRHRPTSGPPSSSAARWQPCQFS